MESLKRLLVAGVSAILSGCAGYASSLDASTKPSNQEAYIYGKFSVQSKVGVLGTYQTMGFELKCDNGQKVVIKFLAEPAIQLIGVPASKCALDYIVYTAGGGEVRSRKPVYRSNVLEIDFKPGSTHYVGDYTATANASVSGGSTSMRWELTGIKDNFRQSTSEFHAQYRNFASLPTVKSILFLPS